MSRRVTELVCDIHVYREKQQTYINLINKLSKQKWPLLSEVKSIGFEWSEWPVPGTPNTAYIDLKFCWADECKNNHGVNRKTVTCGGCMKARSVYLSANM